jgi:DNA-binding NtrC family response regulator
VVDAMSENVLLISNKDDVLPSHVRDICMELGVKLLCADTYDDTLLTTLSRQPDLVLCDLNSLEKIKKRWPRINSILIADHSDSEHIIRAMKLGALDYLLKPLNQKSLLRVVRESLRISRNVLIPADYEIGQKDQHVKRIIGRSPAMQVVYKLIGLVAPRDINILITGESGTGKEMIARAIYHHSQFCDKSFLAVNCAAIPETLLESELFGHEKGAFTGADRLRIGKFEQCHGGTIFLDEVGDMSLSVQSKLLRVLQDGTFQRLGSTDTSVCEVRVIAATNLPLEHLIKEKRFRQDLYYRLNVAQINVPPLREREVDVVLLANYFVKQWNPKFGTQICHLSPAVLPVLLSYPWPGNVRELENVIKSSLVVARGSELRLEFLPDHIQEWKNNSESAVSVPEPVENKQLKNSMRQIAKNLIEDTEQHGFIYKNVISRMEREVIRVVLDHTGGLVAPAAKMLGISRITLRKKMAEFNIRVTTTIKVDNEPKV